MFNMVRNMAAARILLRHEPAIADDASGPGNVRRFVI
jgi:hypothetical protein